MTKAVVLDVDDTLYLERTYVRSGFRAVGQWARHELGVDGVAETAWALFVDGVRRTTLTDALEACGAPTDPGVRDRAVQVYRDHEPDIELLPDARALLAAVRHAPIGVITDGPQNSQRAKCDALGLSGVADVLLVTSDHGRSKPDPWCYEYVERELGLAGPDCLYVADNPAKDFSGARAQGWCTLRVRRTGSLHEGVRTEPGVREVADLWSCVEALRVAGVEGLHSFAASR